MQPEVRQPAQHGAARLLVDPREHGERRGELGLRFGPPARRGEDPAVVGPAVPADGGEPAAAHVVVGGPQPLLGPADVVRALAGVEQPAEHAFDDGQVVDLARADRGQRLVEAGHALGDVPGEREHDPERGERLAFEVAVLAAARGGDGLFVQPLLHVEAATGLGLGEQHPAVLVRVGPGPFEEAHRLPDPAAVDGPVAVHGAVEPAQGARGPRGGEELPLAAVGGVRVFVRPHRGRVVELQVQRPGLRFEGATFRDRAHGPIVASAAGLVELPGRRGSVGRDDRAAAEVELLTGFLRAVRELYEGNLERVRGWTRSLRRRRRGCRRPARSSPCARGSTWPNGIRGTRCGRRRGRRSGRGRPRP